MLRLSPRLLALLVAVVATAGTLTLLLMMPPFQNPDEEAHLRRADQISLGGLVAHRFGQETSGGRVDARINAALRRFAPIVNHREVKATRPMYDRVPWMGLDRENFTNTGFYPPILYLPAAAAIAVARHHDTSILAELRLGRLACAVVSVAIATLAIALAGAAAPWIAAVLLLPMSLACMAALSQDGPMLALAALATSLCLRLQRTDAPRPHVTFWVMVACLALVASARPPYAALALLPLATAAPRRSAVIGALVVVGCTLAWSAVVMAFSVPASILQEHASLSQLKAMLHDPLLLPRAIAYTIRDRGRGLAQEFVGELGWLDTDLPGWLRWLAVAGLAIGLVATLAAGSARRMAPALIVVVAIAAAGLGVFLIQFLTWGRTGFITRATAGIPYVYGVQGRYFLPLAVAFGAALAGAGPIRRPAALALGALPIAIAAVSLPVLASTILLRYYL